MATFICSTLVLFFVSSINCWVFTDVNFTSARTKNLDFIDMEIDDSENYVDPTDPDLRLSLIYPGTKWCGAGNIADGYDDLGSQVDTDKCCREHDQCPDTIESGDTKYNLTNTVFYSRLSCKCDEDFRQCLRATESKTSNAIGNLYFNLLGTKCFRKDYPVIKCKKYGGFLKRKCIVYAYNTNGEQLYQWFDEPSY